MRQHPVEVGVRTKVVGIGRVKRTTSRLFKVGSLSLAAHASRLGANSSNYFLIPSSRADRCATRERLPMPSPPFTFAETPIADMGIARRFLKGRTMLTTSKLVGFSTALALGVGLYAADAQACGNRCCGGCAPACAVSSCTAAPVAAPMAAPAPAPETPAPPPMAQNEQRYRSGYQAPANLAPVYYAPVGSYRSGRRLEDFSGTQKALGRYGR